MAPGYITCDRTSMVSPAPTLLALDDAAPDDAEALLPELAVVLYLVYLELDSVPPVAELLGDLAALVAGGVKAVVRFAYSSVRGALPTEPEPAAVIAHIQALAPVFNAPGVVTVQVDQRNVGCTSAQI